MTSTKRILGESLKKLLRKRTLDKVTIKDIVEDCCVNRQTFYYYFHNVYELLEWIFQDEIERLMEREIDYDDWTTGLELLIRFVRDNRNMILNTYHSVSHEAVVNYSKRFLRPFAERIVYAEIADLEPIPNQEDVDFVIQVITLVVNGFVLEWVGKQLQDKFVTDNVRKATIAIKGSVYRMLRNLEEARNE